MRQLIRLKSICAGFVVFGMAACATMGTSEFQSTRSAQAVKEPGKMLLVFQTGGEYGRDFYLSVEQDLHTYLAHCGIASELLRIAPLELNPELRKEREKAYAPGQTLVIKFTGGTQTPFGIVTPAFYDVHLFDTASGNGLWRTHIRFRPFGPPTKEAGQKFSQDLLGKMQQDGLLARCKKP